MAPIEQLLAHREFVRRLAWRLVEDPHTAEDVAQQAFLIALQSGPSSEAAARSWFARVVRNVVINLRAAEAARKSRELAHESERTSATPHTALASAETSAALRASLSSLEPIYRDVLWLRFYQGLSPHEIAERLGVGVETVRTRQKRGMARLKDSLERRRLWGLSYWLLSLRRRVRPLAWSAAPLILAILALVLFEFARRSALQLEAGNLARAAVLAPNHPVRSDRSREAISDLDTRREPAPVSAPIQPAGSDAMLASVDALEVEVTVELPDGAPARGALVWIRRPDEDGAVVAAECGALGAARLTGVPRGSWVGASLEPFSESLLWRIDAPQFGQTAEKTVRLQLLEPGPALSIRIVDEAGRAMPQATVRITPDRRPQPTEVDRFLAHRERRIAAGEHDGSIAVRGLRPYMWTITAQAPGHAEACARSHLRANHAENEVLLTLSPGRALSGSVRFRDGRPAPNALVRVDPGFPFEPRSTHADEFGAYALDRLPDVELALHAFAREGDAGRTARATCGPDAREWHASLESGGLAIGEVIWDDGEPITRAELHLLHGSEHVSVVSDELGRFAFEVCPPPPFDIAVVDPNSKSGYACVAKVTDETRPVRITAPRLAARLDGVLRVDERDGPRPFSLWLRALDWSEDREIPIQASTRSFVVEAAPGRFELLAWESGYAERLSFATLELAAGQRARADYELGRRGSLEVTGLDPELRQGRVVLMHPDGRVAAWKSITKSPGATLATFAAPQGRYAVRFESEHLILETDELCLAAGAVERVELEAGIRRLVLGTLRLPSRLRAGPARPTVAIHDASGRKHFSSSFEPREQIEFDALLEDGQYVLTARLAQREVRREFLVAGRSTCVSVLLEE